MKMVLKGLEDLELRSSVPQPAGSGEKHLMIKFCGICRTDAKMYYEGQRDLVFPRVPGHEVTAEDPDTGEYYTVWPGRSCGSCSHCRSGRENLCEDIQIMGFHFDGGYTGSITVEKENLIPLGDLKMPETGTFAEPMGCLINIFSRIEPEAGSDIIIYGGGSLGLMAAYYSRQLGFTPLIIEKDEEKIAAVCRAAELASARVEKDTTESDFSAAINTCADNTALAAAITKLRKGGRLLYFSGVKKNEHLDTNLLNLIHYRELRVTGSYGLSRSHMRQAADFILKNEDFFMSLITDIVPLETLNEIMPRVISGKELKFIMAPDAPDLSRSGSSSIPEADASGPEKTSTAAADSLLARISACITPVPEEQRRAARARIDDKAKPLGGFGRIEELAVRLSAVQNSLSPRADNGMMLVFAADHGITEEGVSAYPQEVTRKMVRTYINGQAAINVLCRSFGIDSRIIDVGVNYHFPDSIKGHRLFIDRKVRMGSRNMALQPAMTREEAEASLEQGIDVFMQLHRRKPIDVLGLGEVGIGNTSAAAAIIIAATGRSAAEITGRGTGLDDKSLKHKRETLEKVLAFHRPEASDGIDILCKLGGYEIAAMAGAALAAASEKVVVVLDGLISTAAGLIAALINPTVSDYFIIGHKSAEPGHKAAADFLGLEGVLDLAMRLGEGTGAAITMNLCSAACDVMRDMASMDEAGVKKPAP